MMSCGEAVASPAKGGRIFLLPGGDGSWQALVPWKDTRSSSAKIDRIIITQHGTTDDGKAPPCRAAAKHSFPFSIARRDRASHRPKPCVHPFRVSSLFAPCPWLVADLLCSSSLMCKTLSPQHTAFIRKGLMSPEVGILFYY